jgi:hypothetical protein
MATGHQLLDTRPQNGHLHPMPKKAHDPYKAKRHRFYADPSIADGLDALAFANRRDGRKCVTRSEIIAHAAAKLLRANAARLRQVGFEVPPSILTR